jgi:hypothetical protein
MAACRTSAARATKRAGGRLEAYNGTGGFSVQPFRGDHRGRARRRVGRSESAAAWVSASSRLVTEKRTFPAGETRARRRIGDCRFSRRDVDSFGCGERLRVPQRGRSPVRSNVCSDVGYAVMRKVKAKLTGPHVH